MPDKNRDKRSQLTTSGQAAETHPHESDPQSINCFVIMPFDESFDDVYDTIQNTVENAIEHPSVHCFRLDDSRPAGRITDRLLAELKSAFFCVADLTGNKPNVMWELGYAMALGRPVIIVTQQLVNLPFDIHDMQSHEYDRNRLKSTLVKPLRQMVRDTIAAHGPRRQPPEVPIGQLLAEVAELKGMVAQAVRAWNPAPQSTASEARSQVAPVDLEGAWLSLETRSHIYAKVLGGELIAAYCFGADDHLTGAYFGWRKTGEYWFARYAWLDGSFSGFSFLREESKDVLSGAWWEDDYNQPVTPHSPPDRFGVQATWERLPAKKFPEWATQFFTQVEKRGLPSRLRLDDAISQS